MSNLYVGIDDIARKTKGLYVGIDGVARKVKKGYIGVDGVAKAFYSGAIEVSYDGTYTTSDVTIDGVNYTLWTLTKSGTLTVSEDVSYWMCGGGGNGSAGVLWTYQRDYGHPGAGGGGGYVASGTLGAGVHVITVGGARGVSSIGTIKANPGNNPPALTAPVYASTPPTGGSGGSGGGGGGIWNANYSKPSGGSGAGTSTYPFGLTTLKAHCAGGGGGSIPVSAQQLGVGGAGGSNGGSGTQGGYEFYSMGAMYPNGWGSVYPSGYYASGGSYGGGNGNTLSYGSSTFAAGKSATFYGGGGGGGGVRSQSATDGTSLDALVSNGGSGYQGVIYIAIPKS